MSIADEIRWFKQQFAADILPSLAGTPLSFDLVCAIAFQESGELWSKLRLNLPRNDVLRLSVGDTLDRRAFPRDRQQLETARNGHQMFSMAHRLLVEMGDATGIEAYQHVAQNPDKFVHGYGIFQYDLQFFRTDSDFFLTMQWQNIAVCVEKLMIELKDALQDLGLSHATALTDMQSAFVAIIYNTGFSNFDPNKGLKQGHSDGVHFYGENIDRFMKIAAAIPTPAANAGAGRAMAFAAVPQPSIVAVAQGEYDRYHGIDEGDQPLRGRIADYYEAGGGSRNLDPTLDENAWSAAFISFCVKQSGATSDQFRFDLSHSVYVHQAIANADAGTGVFRGHRITEYAPQLGDLIHHNRQGGTLTFDFARNNTGYPSHSVIVVGFAARGPLARKSSH